jgi:hypothetical protein
MSGTNPRAAGSGRPNGARMPAEADAHPTAMGAGYNVNVAFLVDIAVRIPGESEFRAPHTGWCARCSDLLAG